MGRTPLEAEVMAISDYALVTRARLAAVRADNPYMTDRRMCEALDAVSGELDDLIIAAGRLELHLTPSAPAA